MSSPISTLVSGEHDKSVSGEPAELPDCHRDRALVSLDALRGFDMFWILGADAVMHALGRCSLGASPGSDESFEHKDWAGFAFYDLIFPLFVFIVGVSLFFSLSRLVEQHGRTGAIKRVLLRATLLFLFGMFYAGGFTNPWPAMRRARSAAAHRACLCRNRAAVLFFQATGAGDDRSHAAAGYWALLTFVPIRDIQLERTHWPSGSAIPSRRWSRLAKAFDATTTRVTGHYEPGLNLTNHIDFQHLSGRLYDTTTTPRACSARCRRSRRACSE